MGKIIPIFKGKVVRGRFYPFEQELYDGYLIGLEDKIVNLTIKEFKKNRTEDQNKYYWGVVVKLLGEELGYEKDEIHALLGTMFLKDHIELKGKRYTVVRSTAVLKTDEFSQYIEQCKRFAAEQGIYIPDANKININ